MKKIVALLAALILALSMMSIASAEPIKSTYNLSEVGFIDQVGWYWTRDLSLVLRDDTHYELYYREYAFGTTDPGLKANKLIVYSGTYSSAESADDEAGELRAVGHERLLLGVELPAVLEPVRAPV